MIEPERSKQDDLCLSRMEGKMDGVDRKLDGVDRKLDNLHQNVTGLLFKICLGLLAVAGAAVGIKYAGTPIITDISFFLSWGTSIFGIGILHKVWHRIRWYHRMVWISFLTLLLVSVTCRTFVYEAGVTPAPWWYPPILDAIMAWIAISLCISAWKVKIRPNR